MIEPSGEKERLIPTFSETFGVFFIASDSSPGRENVAICTQGTWIERENASSRRSGDAS